MAQHHDAAHATPDDEYLNPTAVSGHEHTDANVWLIVQFAIWLAASAIVTHFLMWGLFTFFVKDRGATAKQAIEFPLAAQQERRLPAGPRLQAIPANEIFEFRQRENAELSEYGWSIAMRARCTFRSTRPRSCSSSVGSRLGPLRRRRETQRVRMPRH